MQPFYLYRRVPSGQIDPSTIPWLQRVVFSAVSRHSVMPEGGFSTSGGTAFFNGTNSGSRVSGNNGDWNLGTQAWSYKIENLTIDDLGRQENIWEIAFNTNNRIYVYFSTAPFIDIVVRSGGSIISRAQGTTSGNISEGVPFDLEFGRTTGPAAWFVEINDTDVTQLNQSPGTAIPDFLTASMKLGEHVDAANYLDGSATRATLTVSGTVVSDLTFDNDLAGAKPTRVIDNTIPVDAEDAPALIDQSGNGFDMLGTATTSPTFNAADATFNNKPSGTFAASESMEVAQALNQPLSRYVIINFTAPASTQTIYGDNATAIRAANTGKGQGFAGTALESASDISGGKHILFFNSNGVNSSLQVDENLPVVGDAGTGDQTISRLMSSVLASTIVEAGNIGRELTSLEIAGMYAYAQSEYGVA